MLFANDIVLMDESRDGVSAKPDVLESKGFKISHTKTEYMDCNFSRYIQRATTTMKIEAKEIPQRDTYHYLRSIISKDGKIDEDVEHTIKTGWLKWRLTSRVLCDGQMSTGLKRKFYGTVIRQQKFPKSGGHLYGNPFT